MFNYKPATIITIALAVQMIFSLQVFPYRKCCTNCDGKGYTESKLYYGNRKPPSPPDKIERYRCPICNGTGYIESAPIQNTIKSTEPSGSMTIDIGNGINMRLIMVSSGSFMMGSNIESPIHKVTITKGYWIGKYEVTQEQWQEVMGYNPNVNISNICGPKKPVEPGSWFEVIKFCNRLNKRVKGQIPEGYVVHLPTEAQWEFAAIGGNKSRGYLYSGSNIIDQVAWFGGNSSDMLHEVGQKQSNELGICDMSGNAPEWCSDWAGRYPSGGVVDPKGPIKGTRRIQRGGSWGVSPGGALVTFRTDSTPDSEYCGFRIVLVRGDSYNYTSQRGGG